MPSSDSKKFPWASNPADAMPAFRNSMSRGRLPNTWPHSDAKRRTNLGSGLGFGFIVGLGLGLGFRVIVRVQVTVWVRLGLGLGWAACPTLGHTRRTNLGSGLGIRIIMGIRVGVRV